MSLLTRSRAADLVERFPSSTILIVGDVMLDQFLVGRVNRLSPEAPVPVVEYDHDEYRAGGAANVAHNIRALGGRVELVGVVGSDVPGQQLVDELQTIGVGTQGIVVDGRRPTTRKLRIVTQRNQQVARVDFETDGELSGDLETTLADRLNRAAADAGVLLISDYLKGTITLAVMRRVLSCARARRVPVLVDPKIPHIDYYAGATLVTPNHHEAEVATHQRIRSTADTRVAARTFRRRVACESVLITRGEHGMWLLEGGPDPADEPDPESGRAEVHLPALAREVSDVTGAGDTVIGTIALGLAAGALMREAAELANHAAGVTVGKFGPSTVETAELLESVGAKASGSGES